MKISKYLVALPTFRGAKGFNHKTILVSAENEKEATEKAKRLSGSTFVGDVKMVDY